MKKKIIRIKWLLPWFRFRYAIYEENNKKYLVIYKLGFKGCKWSRHFEINYLDRTKSIGDCSVVDNYFKF